MKHHTEKTLSDKPAKGRREDVEPPDSETNPPAAQSVGKPFRPTRSESGIRPSPASGTATGGDPLNRNRGAFEGLRRICREILFEIDPRLPNLLHDWSRRRRSIRAFELSRSSRKQITQARTHPGEKKNAVENKGTARALPKLSIPQARQARIIAWRMFRPILRWHHRASIGTVLATYFGILSVASVSATVYFLIPTRTRQPVQKSDVPAADGAVLFNGSVHKFLSDSHTTPADSARLQSQAEEEFRSGNYAAAEIHFRESLPTARFRALTGFQIFLCLLKQGKTAEAETMAGKFPTGSNAKNPSGIYVQAAFALMQSRPEDAHRDIESARRQFSFISPFYEKALNDAALTPVP